MTKSQKLDLILEKENGKLWGRITVSGNLLVASAANLPALEKKLKKILADFEGLADAEFRYAYDLTVFFEEFNFLNQSKIAEFAGINPGLIRQYSSGHKQASREQVSRIEDAVKQIGFQLGAVRLSTKSAGR